MSLTNDEIAWVLGAPKRVTEQFEWTQRPGRTLKYECSFSVRVPSQDDPQAADLGKVEVATNQYESKCAFIYSGICIPRWESAGPHTNPDGQRIDGEHKHTWDEVDEDRYAYAPDDIDTSSRDTILMSFLDECGIIMEGASGSAAEPSDAEGNV